MRTIQMVVTSDDTSLFLIDFNEDTNELTFRSSRNPEYKQTEKIEIKDDVAYLNLHYFHMGFIQKLTESNQS